MNKNGRKTGRIVAISGILAAFASMVISRAVQVELSIDIAPRDGGGLVARWEGGEVALEAIDAAYAPHRFAADVTAPPGGELDGGFQVIAMASPDSVALDPPEAWAAVHTFFYLTGAARPATLALSGWGIGPRAYLSFETDLMSGSALVRDGSGESRTLDLKSEGRGRVVAPLAPLERLQRYGGRIPARALASLQFVAPDGGPLDVRRLVVNGPAPHTFLTPDGPPRAPVGLVTRSWEPDIVPGGLALPDASYPGTRAAHWFPVIFALLVALGFAGRALYRSGPQLLAALARGTEHDYLAGPYPWRRLAALWGGTFLVWFIFLVAFYPGTLNVDSLQQWEQSATFQFEPQHPPFYAWLMWLARHLWDSPDAVALPQVFIGAGLVAFAANLLWQAGVPRAAVLAAWALMTCSPKNLTSIIALIKDTPYALCMFAGCLCIAWIALRGGRARWMPWALLGFAFGAATLFRHNGPLMAAGTLPFLALFLHRQWRRLLICIAVMLSTVMLARVAVLNRIPIAETDGGLHDLLAAHTAILLDRDVPMSNAEYEFLARVRDLEDRWAYDKRRVAATTMPFLNGVYHRAEAKSLRGQLDRYYLSLVARNPLTAARYFWDRSAYLSIPWTTSVPMETYFLGITRNGLGLSNFQVFLDIPDQLEAALAWTAAPGRQWLFWRPALPLYLILIACAVLALRTRNSAWLIVYIPFLVNTATIALAAISQASRYHFPLTLAAAFLIALALLPPIPREAGRPA
ncbi:MAG: glycosyltransferase family 39 protein [Candidatus Hydrogenedentes bacterium]|nr:glycosyltransferase family 39 protein [Candidatus Hydrogenedentota bacterium]